MDSEPDLESNPRDGQYAKRSRPRTQKKKIQDRLAQRALRERTKQRIATLEDELTRLRSGDNAGNTASLLQVIRTLRDNDRQLRSALDTIRGVISQVGSVPLASSVPETTEIETRGYSPGVGLDIDGVDGRLWHVPDVPDDTVLEDHLRARPQSSKSFPEPAASPEVQEDSTEQASATPVHGLIGIEDESVLEQSPVDKAFGIPFNNIQNLVDVRSLANEPHFELEPSTHANIRNDPSPGLWLDYPSSILEIAPFMLRSPPGTVPDHQKWHVGNSSYLGALTSVIRRRTSATNMDFHVAFEAVMLGWTNVSVEAEQHPVWDGLRQVDQRIFGNWSSKAQRVAMMYICQTLIQYREESTPGNLARIPDFLRPRPSQERLEHPVVVDFLVWPAMRDRMVFEHAKYSISGAFSKAYVDNFTFSWPYSDEHIFSFELIGQGRYRLSDVFLQYVYDYRNWSMMPDFFAAFPEMKYDVPAFDMLRYSASL